MRPCSVINPKIEYEIFESDNDEWQMEKQFEFQIIMEIGGQQQVNIEYLLYDPLTFIGTVGGTLGLFLGFSFYDFIIKIVEFFGAIKLHLSESEVQT